MSIFMTIKIIKIHENIQGVIQYILFKNQEALTSLYEVVYSSNVNILLSINNKQKAAEC